MATVTAAGSPHVVPVVFALVGDVAYTAVDGKPKTTTRLQRLVNVEATGRATLLVDAYAEDWSGLWWVRFDATAQVLKPDNSEATAALDALTSKYPQYVREPPPGPFIALHLLGWRSWEATPSP
jgi:PPOX class probable F420-dependent enzyme